MGVFLKGNQLQSLFASLFSTKTQQLCESYKCVMHTTKSMEQQGHQLWQKFYGNMPLDRWDGMDWGSYLCSTKSGLFELATADEDAAWTRAADRRLLMLRAFLAESLHNRYVHRS